MKIHHKRTHGESIAGRTVECGSCGVEFSKTPVLVKEHTHHFCSKSCRIEWKAHSDRELIDELLRLRDKFGRTPHQTHLSEHSQFNKKAYKRAFGGWNEALRQAGMEPNRENHSRRDCLEDIRATAEKLGRPPQIEEHRDFGSISPQCIRSKFESWSRAVSESGLDSDKVREYDISKDDLLLEIEQLAKEIDDVPTKEEMDKFGKYAAATVAKRFMTWNNALQKAGFKPNQRSAVTVECANCGDSVEKIRKHVENADNNFCTQDCHYDWFRENAPAGEDHPQYKPDSETAYYGPNWSTQRKKARRRDNFLCQRCGISDTNHIDEYGCKLHVHHITPWHEFDDYEKRNALSNLVTLCAKCHQKIEMLPVDPEFNTD